MWKRPGDLAASTFCRRALVCPRGLVAAVGDLRRAVEVRSLVVAERPSLDLGRQRDGGRGEDQGGDEGLGKHDRSPGFLGGRSDAKPLAETTMEQEAKIKRETAHAGRN